MLGRRSSLVSSLALAVAVLSCERALPLPPAPDQGLRRRPAPALSLTPQPSVSRTVAAPAAPAAAAPAVAQSPPGPRRRFGGGGPTSVPSRTGLVTSSEAHATRAGVEMLERGGNAVDAAVATAFALAVTHPSAGNIGGGGFMLVRPPGHDAVTTAFDFRETAPAALTREGFERMQRGAAKPGAAVGVPGSVAGLLRAHERFGRLPREQVLSPAIALAQGGFVLARRPAELLAGSYAAISQDATLRKRFGDATGAKPKAQGARIVQPELAGSLIRIQQRGAEGFYGGETARAIAATPGTSITIADLQSYRCVERAPRRSNYRGLQVETMPPPSAGGVALTETLGLLELVRAHEASGVQELHLFLEASRRAQAERRFGVSDPDALASEQAQAALSRFLDAKGLLGRAPIDPSRATRSSALAPLYPGAEAVESEQTTHLSTLDRQGMVVSLTTTISASYGAKVTAPGTGIVLNNAVASFSRTGENQPAPSKRTVSSMAPTLVLDEGRVVLVLGTPGGDTIPTTIAQVLRNVVDKQYPLDQAVAAPRIHQSFFPDRARFELKRPLPPQVVRALKALGHNVTASHLAMGDSNDILLEDEQAYAVADPRGGGLAAAPHLASDSAVEPPTLTPR
jgi:gamma-glutamyltranspeptidase / glutathione hydrolase